MPHFIHHKRRHSWPYCGPGPRRNTPTLIRVPEHQQQQQQQTHREDQFLTPLVSGDFLEDDAASAGIVRSKTERSYHRIWPHSKSTVTHHPGYSHGGGSFRRMIRPPLDKARSLFVLPTAASSAGVGVVVSYWIPPQRRYPGDDGGDQLDRGRKVSGLPGHLDMERNHHRCHSEQPRAWRRPSASLWTLTEE
ncbi:hypothetical protein BBP40_006369 [Aspergillus hancockii]|nr:hypothetical protein BBP40_006369 [Aspergillus hancockii]